MTTGHADYLTGILRRLVFRITELLEVEPTEDETERAPTSEWAFNHANVTHRKIGARAYDGVGQVLTDRVAATKIFTGETYDFLNDFDLTTEKYTVSVAGLYMVSFCFQVDNPENQNLMVRLRKNDIEIREWRFGLSSNTNNFTVHGMDILELDIDDILHFNCWSISDPIGTDLYFEGGEDETWINIVRLGQ